MPSLAARGLGVLALACLVAVATTAGVGGGAAPGSLRIAVLALGGLAVAGIVLSGLLGGGFLTRVESRRRTKVLVGAAVVAVLATLAALQLSVGLYWAPHSQFSCFHAPSWYSERGIDFHKVCGPSHTRAARLNPHPSGAPSGGSRLGAEIALGVAGGALVVLVGFGAALALLARRGREAARGDEEEVVLAAVEESLDDLRRERDVRRAIVASYARMEWALAASGAGRRPGEAPFEYLARVLEQVAAGAGGRLTELFERAKFSVEPMGVREKEAAIAALEELRGAVAG